MRGRRTSWPRRPPLASERLVRIGFAAESQDLLSNAADKLERKRLDLIVANDISRTDSGFGTDDNAVVLLDRTGGQRELPLLPKREVADLILDEALAIRSCAVLPDIPGVTSRHLARMSTVGRATISAVRGLRRL